MNKNFDPRVPAPRGDGVSGAPLGLPQGARPADWQPPQGDYGFPAAMEDEGASFNPLQLLVYVLRYRWLILGLLLTGLLAGILVTMAMPPRYRAEALLEVMPPTTTIIKDLQVLDEASDIRTYKTALTKLTSRQMMRRVAHELGLVNNRRFLFPEKDFSVVNFLKRMAGNPLGDRFEKLTPLQREERAVEILQRNFSATLLRRTRIIRLTYSSTDPVMARRIVNQFASSFIATKLDQSSEASRLARQFIAEQVAEVKQKLEKAEKALVEYAKEAGITLNEDGQSLIAANMTSINEALSEAIQERLKYERLVGQIRAGKAMELEEVINSRTIQDYRKSLAALRAKYRQMSRIFKPGYPEMRELKAQIDELDRLMRQDVKAIADSVILKYRMAVKKEQDLRRKLRELEAKQAEYQDKNIRYTILKREVDSYRSQYKSLIDKLNKLGVAAEIRNKTASIVQAASTPTRPYAPSLLKNLAVALLLSAGVAAAVIYVLELMNNTFMSPDQLETELKLPVLGILPHVDPERLADELADPRSQLSEAYRTLRTSLQFTGTDGAPRSLMITSSEPREGKSTVVRKLAEEFGALGLNVLIVDADMRKPMQHRLAGIPNTLGLSNLLTNTVPVIQAEEEVEVMRNTPWKNVWLVTAGTLPPNPANLLASQKMGMFIEACCRRFDIVLIDAPPVMGLADSLLLARLAEATLLVVAARQATRKAVQNAVRRLQAASGYVVGTAFNRFQVDHVEYKYGYSYMNYGYLAYDYYGYGAENGGEKSAGQRKLLKFKRKKRDDSRAEAADGAADGDVSGRAGGHGAGGSVEPADSAESGAGDAPESREHGGKDSVA